MLAHHQHLQRFGNFGDLRLGFDGGQHGLQRDFWHRDEHQWDQHHRERLHHMSALSRLRPGDAVSVVAPSGPFDRESLDRGLSVLTGWGLVPRVPEGVLSRHRYLAGTDARRGAELAAAFADAETKAIFWARGGSGAARLLPTLDVRALAHKPVIGFSDTTSMHLRLQQLGRESVHGPVLTQLGRLAVTAPLGALLLDGVRPALQATHVGAPGTATGRLLGGNLTVLCSMLGTPYLPDFRGALLLLEDVTERPYRLDRLLTQLSLAGLLGQVAGVVFGTLTGCEEKDANYTAQEVVLEILRAHDVPSAFGFPIGHGDENLPVVLGSRYTLDATQRTLTPVPSP